jgi:hypothetical protein
MERAMNEGRLNGGARVGEIVGRFIWALEMSQLELNPLGWAKVETARAKERSALVNISGLWVCGMTGVVVNCELSQYGFHSQYFTPLYVGF